MNKEENLSSEEEIDFSMGDSIYETKRKRKNYERENHSKKIKNNNNNLKLKEEEWWKEYITKEPTLEEILNMVKEISSTTSRNEKIIILKKHVNCVKILLYVNNPFWQYYISSIRVRKTISNVEIRSQYRTVKNIFHLLDMLKSREIIGNIALASVCNFININKRYENLLYCILDKNLKIRCGTATINSVFPKLIPEFPVALAEKITDIPENYINFNNDVWFALRKFDGVRVIAMVKVIILFFLKK